MIRPQFVIGPEQDTWPDCVTGVGELGEMLAIDIVTCHCISQTGEDDEWTDGTAYPAEAVLSTKSSRTVGQSSSGMTHNQSGAPGSEYAEWKKLIAFLPL
ncbi:MAG: hypothetical protein KDA86_16170 [Planctomycetaceae bacterium]|nr:hypothetical protein [Planctomycetaceae bacterium]